PFATAGALSPRRSFRVLARIGAVRKAVDLRRSQGARVQPLLVRPRLLRARPPRRVHDLRVDDLGSQPQSPLLGLSRPRPGRAPRPLPALRLRARRSYQPAPPPRGDADPGVPRARHRVPPHRARPGTARDPPRPRRAEQRLPRLRRAEPHGARAAARRPRSSSQRHRPRLHSLAGRAHGRPLRYRYSHRRPRGGRRLRHGRGVVVPRPSPLQPAPAESACPSRRRASRAPAVRGRHELRGAQLRVACLIALALFNSLFAMSYLTLLPIYADAYFGAGSTGFGLLNAAHGTGALVGTLTVATIAHLLRRGHALLTGAACVGMALMLFSRTHGLAVALPVLVIVGFCNTFYLMQVSTYLQQNVPDHLRGRVMSLYSLCWNLLPLGGLLAGALAAAVDARFAVLFGGFMVTA